jgi:glycosyltransferase involved in cell wall biosynthesis
LRLGVVCSMVGLTGYAELGRECVLGLHKLGVDIELKVLDKDLLKYSLLPENILKFVRKHTVKNFTKGIPVFTIGPPTQYDRSSGGKQIGIALWEAYVLPTSWLLAMNSADLLITFSDFNKELFVRQGLARNKIEVVPPAVDCVKFNPSVPPLYIQAVRPFTVLFIGQMILRKGYDKLIIAALRTFKKHEDVCVILKLPPSSARDTTLIMEKLQFIKREAGPSKAALYFNNSAIPIEKIPMLYQIVNKKVIDKLYPYLPGSLSPAGVFCLPSLGEGIGLPYLEAMASGVLTIGTNVTGSYFLNNNNSILIQTEGVKRSEADQSLYGNSFFPGISSSAVSEALLKAYNISSVDKQAIIKQARLDAEGFTYEKTCKAILTAIQQRI